MRRVVNVVMSAMLGLGLAACSAAPVPPQTPPPPAAASIPKPPPPRPAPPPVSSPPSPPAAADSLTGLGRDEVRALLGPPASETARAMGTVWRYRRGDCALSLVFYPEVETSVERVLGYEFEGGKDAGACLKRLRDAGGRNGK